MVNRLKLCSFDINSMPLAQNHNWRHRQTCRCSCTHSHSHANTHTHTHSRCLWLLVHVGIVRRRPPLSSGWVVNLLWLELTYERRQIHAMQIKYVCVCVSVYVCVCYWVTPQHKAQTNLHQLLYILNQQVWQTFNFTRSLSLSVWLCASVKVLHVHASIHSHGLIWQ